MLTEDDLRRINSNEGILELLKSKKYNVEKILKKLQYVESMEYLQEELIKLQNWMINSDKRVLIIFEGRDAAGKGGTIKRFTDGLMPRYHRVIALSKPSESEKGQWYFNAIFHICLQAMRLFCSIEAGTTELWLNLSTAFAPKNNTKCLCHRSMILKKYL